VEVLGNPPGTVAITLNPGNSGGDLSKSGATITVNDQQFTLESVFRTNRFFRNKNFTTSYTGGNWDFSYTTTYFSGTVKSDSIAIDGTAQHVVPAGGAGQVFNYTNSISAANSPPDGSKITNTVGPSNVLHLPDGFDQFTTTLQGVVHNPWLGGREFNPWTFSLNATHFMGMPPPPPAPRAAAGPFNEALGINGLGQIVGQFGTGNLPDVSYHGFLVNKNDLLAGKQNFSTIDFPGAASTIARGINDGSQIVGQYLVGNVAHGFRLTGSVFSTIDFPGAADTTLFGINNAGQIVGVYTDASRIDHGFLFGGGVFTTIDFPGATSSEALGINELGQIVGQYSDGSTFHSFLLSGGVFTTIDPPGATISGASGINDLGQIVGPYFDANFDIHGFELTGSTFSTIDFPGAVATGIRGIDDAGQFVGIYADATMGSENGFLFHEGNFFTVDVPVPEPSTLALLCVGALGVFVYNWCKGRTYFS